MDRIQFKRTITDDNFHSRSISVERMANAEFEIEVNYSTIYISLEELMWVCHQIGNMPPMEEEGVEEDQADTPDEDIQAVPDLPEVRTPDYDTNIPGDNE